jgi:uncharacterized membrane protein
MRQALAWTGKSLGFAALCGYPVLIHMALVKGMWGPTAAVLTSLPLFIIAIFILARSRDRFVWLIVVVAALLYAASLHYTHDSVVAATGVPHAICYLSMLALFGQSLLPGREAMVTVIARKIHKVFPPVLHVYTRKVTWAWCIFFAVQPMISLALLLWAPLEVWSLFVNVLNFPLVVLMFAAEYSYRITHFSEYPQPSLFETMRGMSQRNAPEPKHVDVP